MKFEWKLHALQCKLEWDLDLARAGVAGAARKRELAQEALRTLERSQAAQASAALATATRADPALHAQCLAWLAAAELMLQRARTACARGQADLDTARAACRRLHERLEVLTALHDEELRQFEYDRQREAAKEADFIWLASRAGRESP